LVLLVISVCLPELFLDITVSLPTGLTITPEPEECALERVEFAFFNVPGIFDRVITPPPPMLPLAPL
jgi:hypothetical protein